MKQLLNLKNLKISEVLFYIFLFCLPFQTRILYSPESAYVDWYFNYHLAIFVYLTDLILVSCFLAWIFFDKRKLSLNPLLWLILAFFILILGSLLHVKHLNLGLIGTFRWLEVGFIILYAWTTFKEWVSFMTSVWIIWFSALFQAILGIVQFHVQHMLGFSWIGEYIAPMGTAGLSTIDTIVGKVLRAYGTFPHPNVLGLFLFFGLFMGFFLVSRETNTWKSKILVSCGTIVMSLGLFVSFSRLAWVAAIIAFLCFFGFAWLHKHWKSLILLSFIGIVSCGTIAIAYNPYLKARALDRNEASVVDRYFFNNAGLYIMALDPAMGSGVGNYVPAMAELNYLEAWQYQPPHNIFIFVAAELGLPGMIILILIIWEIFRRTNSAPKSLLKFSLLALGLIILLVSQFDHYLITIQQGRLMFAVVLGLLVALPNLKSHDEKPA